MEPNFRSHGHVSLGPRPGNYLSQISRPCLTFHGLIYDTMDSSTLVYKAGSFVSKVLTAGDNSIDRFPENRPKYLVYLLIALGLGTPA